MIVRRKEPIFLAVGNKGKERVGLPQPIFLVAPDRVIAFIAIEAVLQLAIVQDSRIIDLISLSAAYSRRLFRSAPTWSSIWAGAFYNVLVSFLMSRMP